MKSAIGLGLIAALAMAAPSVAQAQDAPGATHRHCPTCGAELPNERCPTCGLAPGGKAKPAVSDEDRELDRVLRREYGDPNGPAPPHRVIVETPPAPPPAPPSTKKHKPRHHHHEDDDDAFYVHLGVYGAHWASRLSNVSVASGRNGSHADSVPLSGGSSAAGDLDGWSQTQLFRAWIDLGPWFSFDGGAYRNWFRDSGQLGRDFQFKGQQYTAGAALDTKFETLVADFNFVVHPVHGRFGHLDLLLGARYLFANVGFSGDASGGYFSPPMNKATQTLDAVLPMIGIGGTLRPVHTKNVTVEISARARVGGFDWEEQGYTQHHRRHSYYYYNGSWHDREFYAYTGELDGSVSLVLFKTLGFQAGYHWDVAHIEKRDDGDRSRADWRSHGPYGGVFVQF